MKWFLTILFLLAALLSGGYSLWWKSELKKANLEFASLREREKEIGTLKKSLKEQLKNQNEFLKYTKSDSFLDQQIKIREAEQKQMLEYLPRLEKADAEMEAQLALWREAKARSLNGRQIERLIPKSGPIIRDITFDKIENNVLYYRNEDNSADQIELSKLSKEALTILLDEEFIVPEIE